VRPFLGQNWLALRRLLPSQRPTSGRRLPFSLKNGEEIRLSTDRYGFRLAFWWVHPVLINLAISSTKRRLLAGIRRPILSATEVVQCQLKRLASNMYAACKGMVDRYDYEEPREDNNR
jgi:hypothetical protein